MDTEAIRHQTAAIDAAAKAVATTRDLISKVSARNCGQELAGISVNGIGFAVTVLNRSYMPELAAGMEAIQRECLAILWRQLAAQKSVLEGAEWKLHQLVKAV